MRTGVAWFLREDWDEIRRLCPDLHDDYDAWLADAEAAMLAMANPDMTIEKVVLRPHHIRRRQRATGRRVNGAARAKLVTSILRANARAADP